MSAIVDFFHGEPDIAGRTLAKILSYSDDGLETSHTLIQWVFPLHEGSLHNSQAPVLTAEDIRQMKESEVAKTNMKAVYARFMEFWGFEPLNTANQKWCANRNHNLLRITRAIRSLRLFSLDDYASSLYDKAIVLAITNLLDPKTLEFWAAAHNDPVESKMLK